MNRYWLTVTGVLRASCYIISNYPIRKNALIGEVSNLLPEMGIPTGITDRLRRYIPPFLLIEFLYTQLWGQTFSKQQTERSMLLNGLTPLFDDLVDELQLNDQAIRDLLLDTSMPDHPKAIVCRGLFRRGNFTWDQYWEAVAQVQIASKNQMNGEIPLDELYIMTIQKGAASVELGWHVIIEEQGGSDMKKIASSFGAFAQIINDIFDVWKDREAGIQTLVTSTSDIRDIQRIYKESIYLIMASIRSVNVGITGKNRLIALLVPIFCLGECALERLYNLQAANSGKFNVQRFSRAELVCDMAQWKNRWRWTRLVLGWRENKWATPNNQDDPFTLN